MDVDSTIGVALVSFENCFMFVSIQYQSPVPDDISSFLFFLSLSLSLTAKMKNKNVEKQSYLYIYDRIKQPKDENRVKVWHYKALLSKKKKKEKSEAAVVTFYSTCLPFLRKFRVPWKFDFQPYL